MPTPAPTSAECQNGQYDAAFETDVDCGGTCPPCVLDQDCVVSSDCVTGLACVDSTCAPAPTPAPTMAPTRTPIVGVSVGMAGLTCTEFDDDSGSTVIVTVLDDIIPGSSFSDPTCSDPTDDSISVYLEVSAARFLWTASYDSMFSYVDTELTTVVSDGSFTAAIIAEATRRRLTWARRLGLADATVTGVTTETFSPSPAPTLAPVPSPTSLPIPSPTRAPVVATTPAPEPVPAPADDSVEVGSGSKSKGSDGGLSVTIIIVIVVVLVLMCCIMVVVINLAMNQAPASKPTQEVPNGDMHGDQIQLANPAVDGLSSEPTKHGITI